MKDTIYIGGFHSVMAALEDGEVKPMEVLLADHRQDERSRRIAQLARSLNIQLHSLPKSELDMLAPELRHQGVLAKMPAPVYSGEDALDVPATPDQLLLVLDGVQDPHNLGACLRTAEAVGVNAVIIPRDRAASLSPVARKAAAGAAERVPVLAVTNLARSLKKLSDLGYWITGLAGDASDSVFDADLSGPRVLVMGSEGEGLRRLTREHCHKLVRIPMLGKAESLNVSVAAAVCLYEAFRQQKRG